VINIFCSGYFIPLCLCDFSIHCIRIHHWAHLQSRSVLLVYLGERTGSLLGIISLSISDFYIGSVQCLCASYICILCLYSVFFFTSSSFFFLLLYFLRIFPMSPCIHLSVLHHPSPSVWRALYLEGHIYLKGPVYLWRLLACSCLLVRSCSFLLLRPRSTWHFDTSCVKNGANWSLEIRTMYQATYTLYVYIHHVYTHVIPSIWSGGQR
jgi:hypothetical protein